MKDAMKSPLNSHRMTGVVMLATALLGLSAPVGVQAQTSTEALPDAPSALLFPSSVNEERDAPVVAAQNVVPGTPQNLAQSQAASAPAQTPAVATPAVPAQAASAAKPCPKSALRRVVPIVFLPATDPTCQDQLQLIVDTGYVKPLTPTQKGALAVRAVTDPFNLLTIAAFSGISVAADSHSVYGPGFTGWGRLAGYSLAEDVQGEFTGVYAIPSLMHEDPRYHRMPKASVRRRIEHALIHTLVSQHDDGSLMPNYATLINVPLSAEISNLYVPGIGTNAPDTAKRVLVGYGTEPIGPLLAEFLPDFAKRVHVHVIFAQQILDRLALGAGAQPSAF
jgi:hypothetical protein